MGKYSYWTGTRAWTTSNTQMPLGIFGMRNQAQRLPTDTYVKSFWWATFSYDSPGTGAVPSWWANANVYFVAQFDDTNTLTEPDSLGSDEPPGRIAMAGMYPKRYSNPEYSPNYQVVWTSPENGIETTGRRKGNGFQMPQVVAGLYAVDQNGYIGGSTEPSYLRRCSIWGRVLWESDSPPI